MSPWLRRLARINMVEGFMGQVNSLEQTFRGWPGRSQRHADPLVLVPAERRTCRRGSPCSGASPIHSAGSGRACHDDRYAIFLGSGSVEQNRLRPCHRFPTVVGDSFDLSRGLLAEHPAEPGFPRFRRFLRDHVGDRIDDGFTDVQNASLLPQSTGTTTSLVQLPLRSYEPPLARHSTAGG